MRIIDQGNGTPIVFIPGLQGRWEYTRATVDALATYFRVITFPLADEPSAGTEFDPGRAFDSYADHVRAVIDSCGIDRAMICGLSFGGLTAIRFAAQYPARVTGLILASTPGPGWHLRPRHDFYARWPWVFGPLFLMEIPWRARPELRAALPRPADRRAFSRRILQTLIEAPVSLPRMAARARRIATYDTRADCARITAPTLVVTGEPALDYVVPVGASSQYAALIQNARTVVLRQTGHQGTITRPGVFAGLVREFAATAAPGSHEGRVA
jgi:pimeloyl-ACP methyl ester carboxylesterase